jgi:hypothetical protein
MNHHFTKFESGRGHVFDAEAARALFAKGEFTITDGVVRWNSNGSVPPTDLLMDWVSAGCINKGVYLSSVEARDADITRFAREYRRRARPLSGEALAEARANFEPGTVLVDVISGVRTRL